MASRLKMNFLYLPLVLAGATDSARYWELKQIGISLQKIQKAANIVQWDSACLVCIKNIIP